MITTKGLESPISVKRSRFKSVGEHIFWFGVHLGIVYMTAKYCVWWLGDILNFYTHSLGGRMQFVLSHLFLLCFVLGVLGGLAASRLRQKSAVYVWIVPSIFLAAKVAFFFPEVIFEHQIGPAISFYFGSHFLASFTGLQDLMKDGMMNEFIRGSEQLTTTAPFYVSLAYSLSAWLGTRAALLVSRKALD